MSEHQMSDERLAEVRELNNMRKSVDNAMIESLQDETIKSSYRSLAAGTTIDELLAEVERLKAENAKLRAIKNQLQQELAARPER